MIADWFMGHSRVALLLVAALLLAFVVVRRFRSIPVRHRWRRQQARTMCDQLQGRDRAQPPGLVLARLRAMDALAFEELLLESFERRGCRVRRNRRYSGDGGLDGQVAIGGQICLIQAKRYASAIRPEHIEAFAALCSGRRTFGLFIHTGRTGPLSRAHLERVGNVELISGDRLLDLICGRPLFVRGQRI